MLKDEQILQLNSKEYDTLIRKAGTIREFDVNNSYGVRDYFWNYRKTFNNLITEQQYSKILKEVIQAMIDELKLDHYLVLPHCFGYLTAIYLKHTVKLVDGQVKVLGIVDWYKTTQLWYEDEEARNKKQLVFREGKLHKIATYHRSGGYFKNKRFLRLSIKRSVHKELTNDYINKTTIKPIIYG